MALNPSLGQIGAQALNIDVITVKAYIGIVHQRLTLKPFVNVLIVAHINSREQIGFRLQTFGHHDSVAVGRDGHLAVIHVVPAQLVDIGILENVAHLILVQEEDISTLVEVEHGIDGHILAIHWGNRIEVEIVAVQVTEVLRREGDLCVVIIQCAFDPSLGQINTEALQIDVIAVNANLQNAVHNFPA